MTDRKRILNALEATLYPLPYVYAFWLEGADANGTLDAYSDIDIWIDVEDEFENDLFAIAEAALGALSPIDYAHVTKSKDDHPSLRQTVYHLKNTSEYLMIDFNVQLHSRQDNESVLIHGDSVENALVIFDKNGIVRFGTHDAEHYTVSNNIRLEEAKYRYTQHSRVMKYVHRGLYLEARAYYDRYVLEPLIDVLRLVHTPMYADYYLVHISQHIPICDVKRLEYFARITSLRDVAQRVPEAQIWFKELLVRLEEETA